MLDELDGKSAGQIAGHLASHDFTAVELVRSYLERIERHGDPSVFITVTAKEALKAADASDARRADGSALSAWDGVPVAWKDLFDIRGVATTAGSTIYADAIAKEDAAVVATCVGQGLISLGKTNLTEFAYSGLGLNPHYGTPVNPLSSDEPRAPGGSSSGSAVAVAAGLAPIAVGTDTAGSVRVPSSFCGVAGFKSSQNRYDKTGVFALSDSLDSLGAFAHGVDDLIVMDRLMRGLDVVEPKAPQAAGVEIVVPESVVFDGLQEDVLACFEAFVDRLKQMKVAVRRAPFPIFDEVSRLFAVHGTLTVAEAATLHRELLESDEACLMDSRVRERMETARRFTAQDYIRLQWERRRLQDATADILKDAFLLFPTVAMTAPAIGALEADDAYFVKTNLQVLRNTMLGNYLGTPGVSLPIGFDRSGLAVGALLSAPFGRDDEVLAAAGAIETLARA